MDDSIAIRPFQETDSIREITRLLHEAYAPLAAMGLRYTATHQDDDVTRLRLSRGFPWVAELDGAVIATVTLYPKPKEPTGSDWYDRSGIFSFGQFAVKPAHQRHGLGTRLIALMESEAGNHGAEELALDTADAAHHLIGWYGKMGYRIVEHVSWGNTNYRSVVMSKTVSR